MSESELNLGFILLSITLFILLLLIFIIVITNVYQKKHINYNSQVEQMKTKYENSLLSSKVEIQEEAFKHISREIHDNIGQKLTLAKLTLNSELSDLSHTAKIDNAKNLISESISALSELSKLFSGDVILHHGLIKAIEYEVMVIKKSESYDISFEVTGNCAFLEKDIELVVYRISQEALSNIIKHAQATIISINLNFYPSDLELIIQDNGKGFDVTDVAQLKMKHGAGLSNMSDRARQSGGHCSFESDIQTGTTVNVKIPVNYEQFN